MLFSLSKLETCSQQPSTLDMHHVWTDMSLWQYNVISFKVDWKSLKKNDVTQGHFL